MTVLLDVNGTLTDPAGIGEPWGRPDLGPGILDAAIQGAMTDTICGVFRPLAELLRGATVREAQRSGLDPALVDDAVARAGALDPWPDAAEALIHLRDAGIRVAALTNSGADAGRATLEAAGLLPLVDVVLGVDAVRAFKPDGRTYAYAVSELGVAAADVTLVAAHAWDVTGAARAGLRTAWVARGERALAPTTPTPNHVGENLLEVAKSISAAAGPRERAAD